MFSPKLLRARGDIIHITHRLSAVQLADTFAMFDNGSVDKYRTHKELYKKGSIYTAMIGKQAHLYRTKEPSDN